MTLTLSSGLTFIGNSIAKILEIYNLLTYYSSDDEHSIKTHLMYNYLPYMTVCFCYSPVGDSNRSRTSRGLHFFLCPFEFVEKQFLAGTLSSILFTCSAHCKCQVLNFRTTLGTINCGVLFSTHPPRKLT